MLIPEGFAQINLFFVGSPVPTGAQVTFGVYIAEFAGDATEAADEVRTQLSASTLMSNFDASMDMNKVLCKFGPNDTGAFGENTSAIGGGASGVSQVPNTALLIGKTTNRGGRKGRGRMYWPGVPAGVVNESGLIDATFKAAVQTDVSDFLGKLAANDLPMYLLHGDDAGGVTPDTVQSLTVAGTAATQRRRLRR